MTHLTIELLLWMLFLFVIGCVLGCFLRKILTAQPKAAAPTVAATAVATPKPAAEPLRLKPVASRPAPSKPVAKAVPASPVAKPVSAKPLRVVEPAATGKAKRPKGLAAARGGKADDLQQISGIGPKLEKTVQGLGFFHFDQIAKWTADEVQWVDEHLRFKGRIARDEWIAQAKLLAAGDMDKFSRLYGTGGMRNAAGQSRSGTRTRRGKKRKS